MKVAEFSVRNYQFTIIIFVMVLLLGVSALINMPRGEEDADEDDDENFGNRAN